MIAFGYYIYPFIRRKISDPFKDLWSPGCFSVYYIKTDFQVGNRGEGSLNLCGIQLWGYSLPQ